MKRGSARNRSIDRWAGTPLLWLAAALRRRRAMPTRQRVRRVGVLTSTTIGDTLLAGAAVQRIKAIWPHAELVFFAANGNRAAAEMLPAVDRIAPLSLTRPWQTIAAMRSENLDVLVDFSAWQRITALMCARSGAKFTAGFARPTIRRGIAQDLSVEHRGDRHESENFAALVDALEASAGAPHTEAPLRLRDGVFDTPLDPRWNDAVIFHCWATGENAHLREWPEEHWQELAAKLRDRWPDMKLVLTAGPADMPRAEALAKKLDAEIFRGGGIKPAAVLLKNARLVVSVNTGTMHLAAITGAPVIGLCGPTNNRHWGALGPRAIGIQAPGTDCGFLDLGWEYGKASSRIPDCMSRITPQMVIQLLQV